MKADARDPLLAHGVTTAADYAGTFVFAVQGAIAGAGAGLDVFGVLVIAFVTALGGGIVRDLAIGAAPVAALADARYPVIAFLGAACVLGLRAAGMAPMVAPLVVIDAAGLSLFAVAGARKAQRFGLHPIVCAMAGALTASGGGVVRDVLLTEVPHVLRTDIYATAALAGAGVMLAGQRLGLGVVASAVVGGAACFALRLAAVAGGWRLPVI